MAKKRMSPRNGTLQEKLDFWTIPEPNSGCLLWFGPLMGKGYGHIRWKGRFVGIHRLVWEAHHGPIPKGMFVLHKCDVMCCAEINHLFLGTHQDNMDDMTRKGRSGKRGTILTQQQVLAIRSDTRSQQTIADHYGVSQTNISQIKLRKTWADL